MFVCRQSFLSAGVLATSLAQATVINVDRGGSCGELIGVQFTFTVFALVGAISDIDLRLSIAHPGINQLDFELRSPSFSTFAQWDDPGVRGVNFQDTYLDDEAAGARLGEPGSQEGPFASPEWGGHRYRAPSDLSIFDGINPNGEWTLILWDRTPDNSDGRLLKNGDSASWGMAIGTQLIITTVPEPGSLAVLIAGGLAWISVRKRRA